jgi:threonylcarbamoyladenosine tRNA methylthiotransferase MtaB
MPALPGPVVRERARRLRAAGDLARDRFLASCIGATDETLVEQPGLGRTPRYAHVVLTDPAGAPVAATGAVVPARITSASEGRLHGVVG